LFITGLSDGSCACTPDELNIPNAIKTGKRGLQKYFVRKFISASVEKMHVNYFLTCDIYFRAALRLIAVLVVCFILP
jgi:hypothetical protein